jgi:hypothetical protein
VAERTVSRLLSKRRTSGTSKGIGESIERLHARHDGGELRRTARPTLPRRDCSRFCSHKTPSQGQTGQRTRHQRKPAKWALPNSFPTRSEVTGHGRLVLITERSLVQHPGSATSEGRAADARAPYRSLTTHKHAGRRLPSLLASKNTGTRSLGALGISCPLPILVDSTRRNLLIRWQKRAAMWEHGFESRWGHQGISRRVNHLRCFRTAIDLNRGFRPVSR